MRGGTEYAKRVRRVFNQVRRDCPEEPPSDPTEPLQQLLLGLLGSEATEDEAARAWSDLNEQMIDLNEVRVSSVHEISSMIRKHVPNNMECARNIRRVLNDVFHRENRVSLESLRTCGRRDARQYLDSLDGATPHAVASVLLWSLGAHAIPVNRRLLEALRAHGLVDPEAEVAEVQAFLERNIPAAEARTFCLTMKSFADQNAASAQQKSRARSSRAVGSRGGKKSTAETKAKASKSTDRRRKKTSHS